MNDQHLIALEEANRVRFGIAAVKREIADGTLTVGEAVFDPRAQSMRLWTLLACQRLWGPRRVSCFLAFMLIGEDRRVRELTDRQRELVGERLEPRRKAA